MTICIDNVKTKIETVKIKADNSIIDEEKMNKHLDTILLVKKIVDEMVIDIDNLVDDLYEFSSIASIEDYLEIKPLLENLRIVSSKIYQNIRKSVLYSGVKSSMKEFCSSIDSIEEIICDIDMYISLSDDEEYKTLVNKINKMLA